MRRMRRKRRSKMNRRRKRDGTEKKEVQQDEKGGRGEEKRCLVATHSCLQELVSKRHQLLLKVPRTQPNLISIHQSLNSRHDLCLKQSSDTEPQSHLLAATVAISTPHKHCSCFTSPFLFSTSGCRRNCSSLSNATAAVEVLQVPPEQQPLFYRLQQTVHVRKLVTRSRKLEIISGYCINQQPIIKAFYSTTVKGQGHNNYRDIYPPKYKCFCPRTGKVSSFFFTP